MGGALGGWIACTCDVPPSAVTAPRPTSSERGRRCDHSDRTDGDQKPQAMHTLIFARLVSSRKASTMITRENNGCGERGLLRGLESARGMGRSLCVFTDIRTRRGRGDT